MKFVYDSDCYKLTNNLRTTGESIIISYIDKEFFDYKDLLIEFQFVNTKSFNMFEAGGAIPDQGIIIFDFNKYYNYVSSFIKNNGKLLLPTIQNNHKYIFNILHHEYQHLVNNFLYNEIFNYIDGLDTFKYVKVAVKSLLDEYTAAYAAQTRYYVKSGAIEELETLCDLTQLKNSDKLKRYIDIFRCLSYAIAENQVLSDKKQIAPFNNLIRENCSVNQFYLIFSQIQKCLMEFTQENCLEYANCCKDSMLLLLKQLNIDFNYINEIELGL